MESSAAQISTPLLSGPDRLSQPGNIMSQQAPVWIICGDRNPVHSCLTKVNSYDMRQKGQSRTDSLNTSIRLRLWPNQDPIPTLSPTDSSRYRFQTLLHETEKNPVLPGEQFKISGHTPYFGSATAIDVSEPPLPMYLATRRRSRRSPRA